MSPSPEEDPLTLYNTINANIQNKSLSTFDILSSTLTPKGFTASPTNDNQTEGGLSTTALIGLAVGGGVLLLVIIAIVVYCCILRKKKAKENVEPV